MKIQNPISIVELSHIDTTLRKILFRPADLKVEDIFIKNVAIISESKLCLTGDWNRSKITKDFFTVINRDMVLMLTDQNNHSNIKLSYIPTILCSWLKKHYNNYISKMFDSFQIYEIINSKFIKVEFSEL